MYHIESEQWRQAFRSSPVPLALVAPNHRYLAANTAYCSLVGYSEHELIRRTWQSITHPDDIEGDESNANLLASDQTQDAYSIDKRYITRRGNVVYVRLSVAALRRESSLIAYFITAVPYSAEPQNIQQKPEPISITTWVKRNPKDAAIVGLAAALIFGRDQLMKLLEIWIKP